MARPPRRATAGGWLRWPASYENCARPPLGQLAVRLAVPLVLCAVGRCATCDVLNVNVTSCERHAIVLRAYPKGLLLLQKARGRWMNDSFRALREEARACSSVRLPLARPASQPWPVWAVWPRGLRRKAPQGMFSTFCGNFPAPRSGGASTSKCACRPGGAVTLNAVLEGHPFEVAFQHGWVSPLAGTPASKAVVEPWRIDWLPASGGGCRS